MALSKFDRKSDGLADIYRAALYLVRGADEVSKDFLEKARRKLGKEIISFSNKPKDYRERLFFAEKILDQYFLLKSK